MFSGALAYVRHRGAMVPSHSACFSGLRSAQTVCQKVLKGPGELEKDSGWEWW